MPSNPRVGTGLPSLRGNVPETRCLGPRMLPEPQPESAADSSGSPPGPLISDPGPCVLGGGEACPMPRPSSLRAAPTTRPLQPACTAPPSVKRGYVTVLLPDKGPRHAVTHRSPECHRVPQPAAPECLHPPGSAGPSSRPPSLTPLEHTSASEKGQAEHVLSAAALGVPGDPQPPGGGCPQFFSTSNAGETGDQAPGHGPDPLVIGQQS